MPPPRLSFPSCSRAILLLSIFFAHSGLATSFRPALHGNNGLATILLNDPDQKRNTRLKTLGSLRKKIQAMSDDSLLADQRPHLQTVLEKIDSILALKKDAEKNGKELDTATVDKALAEMSAEMDKLKRDLMNKAFAIHAKYEQDIKKARTASGLSPTMKKMDAEAAFEKLMDVQDASLSEQLTVLEKFKDDEKVAKFLENGEFKEGGKEDCVSGGGFWKVWGNRAGRGNIILYCPCFLCGLVNTSVHFLVHHSSCQTSPHSGRRSSRSTSAIATCRRSTRASTGAVDRHSTTTGRPQTTWRCGSAKPWTTRKSTSRRPKRTAR